MENYFYSAVIWLQLHYQNIVSMVMYNNNTQNVSRAKHTHLSRYKTSSNSIIIIIIYSTDSYYFFSIIIRY